MYIKDSLCISPQKTYQQEAFSDEIVRHSGNKYFAIEPDYGDLIPATSLRRMSKLLRMGIGTGLPLLKRYSDIGGIIIATADGGVSDSIKFLNQIEQYNEGTLTPTNFVQSTPNSLAGTLALLSNNNGYNNTHVHEYLSFENVLTDALMYLEENDGKILVGAAEEISEWNFNLKFHQNLYKSENTVFENLINSGSPGTVCGEAAVMFVLDSDSSGSFTRIVDVSQRCSEYEKDTSEMIMTLLERNNLTPEKIDAVITGKNGDVRTDKYYDNICSTLFRKADIYTYRNLFGDFPGSSSLSLWLADIIFKKIKLPEECIDKKNRDMISNILIYNHALNNQQGAILVSGTNSVCP